MVDGIAKVDRKAMEGKKFVICHCRGQAGFQVRRNFHFCTIWSDWVGWSTDLADFMEGAGQGWNNRRDAPHRVGRQILPLGPPRGGLAL
jgi:hypothetical protein